MGMYASRHGLHQETIRGLLHHYGKKSKDGLRWHLAFRIEYKVLIST